MRIGCGCLTIIISGLLVSGLFWLGFGALEQPSGHHEIGTPVEGQRAQQKFFELVAAGSAARRHHERRTTITFSEREVNAVLARYAVSEDLPLTDMRVRLIENGIIELTGQLPLRAFLGDSAGAVVELLPQRWATTPVQLRLRGYVRLETGGARSDPRRLRLDVGYLALGRRRFPVSVLSILPEGPVLRATRRPVPNTVDSIAVESGSLTITVRP